MKKLPKKINILGLVHEVRLVDRPQLNKWDEPGHATVKHSECLIEIEKDMPFSRQMCALLHEIDHTIDNALTIVASKDDNEDFIRRHSRALFQVLSDNKLNFFEEGK